VKSLHLVDPDLIPALNAFPMRIFSHDLLPEVRNREFPTLPFNREGVTLEQRKVPGPASAPDITLHIYRPEGARQPLPCIYHIHGGGYVVGAAKDLAFLHYPLVQQLGCALISVDYRLAPEAPFPAAIEDCYAGLGWVIQNAEQLGVDPSRIGVMGESAGGGLAAALALLARDRGEYSLSFQHLIYPMLDDRTCTRTEPHPFAGEFIWPPANNHFGWSALLGQEPGSEGVSPYAAPARATDLSGLPPVYLSTGSLDLFVDEDLEYAKRLLAAGVPTELRVYPGAYHGFDIFSDAPVAVSARRDSYAALARFLKGRG
jgi:triacylglycerol lipase